MDLYFKIKKQRSSIIAPVDTMGCAAFSSLDSKEHKFKILISLLLSSQTKDEITYKSMIELEKLLNPITPEHILIADKELLHKCISQVGFHNKKFTNLIEISKIILESNIPETLGECLRLPGIGKKMAYLYLEHGCGRSEGIGVDTHVHRITNRIGLVRSKTAEETRIKLEKIFQVDEWGNLNKVLVGFGQKICKAKNPKCAFCCIKEKCPKYDF